jgi:CBS domain-containing protein
MPITSRLTVTVSRKATVMEAIRLMASARIGSVVVAEDGRIEGIFSERDLMLRVVLAARDPGKVLIEEVMTSPVITISKRTTGDEARRMMVEQHIRHLPIVDDNCLVFGIVSMRDLLQQKVDDLEEQLDSLKSYIAADGIGG